MMRPLKIDALMVGKGGVLIPIRGVLRFTMGIFWVGISKSGSYTAVDRYSGFLICKKTTVAECEEFISKHAKRIAEIQDTRSYRVQAERIRAHLAKIQGGANNGTSNEENQW